MVYTKRGGRGTYMYVYVYYICTYIYVYIYMMYIICMFSLLHLEFHSISISNLNLLGLFSTEGGKRDLEN